MNTEVATVSRTKYLYLRVLTSLAPATGRRRVWAKISRLEQKLAEANARIGELEVCLDVQGDHLANTHEDYLEAQEAIMDLQEKLKLAVRANDINSRRYNYCFDGQPLTPYVDRETSAIDVQELRADLGHPLTGKVTQPNPETGNHETVETSFSSLNKAVLAYKVASVRIAQRGPSFASATSVPGMKAS